MSADADYVGTDVSETEMDLVWGVLKDHVGQANAITSDEIDERLGGIDKEASNPQTRKIIRALIFHRQKPIGSGPKGYWVMASKTELEDTIAQLNQRKHAITAREDALVEGFHSYESMEGDRQ